LDPGGPVDEVEEDELAQLSPGEHSAGRPDHRVCLGPWFERLGRGADHRERGRVRKTLGRHV
jgi:hypothetical protein